MQLLILPPGTDSSCDCVYDCDIIVKASCFDEDYYENQQRDHFTIPLLKCNYTTYPITFYTLLNIILKSIVLFICKRVFFSTQFLYQLLFTRCIN